MSKRLFSVTSQKAIISDIIEFRLFNMLYVLTLTPVLTYSNKILLKTGQSLQLSNIEVLLIKKKKKKKKKKTVHNKRTK